MNISIDIVWFLLFNNINNLLIKFPLLLTIIIKNCCQIIIKTKQKLKSN